ncbi:MAG TPA: VOC family protein [Gammaproteobacteria bacterium]|nr:VOC family protein [Gammaproteobacteria bacterium]
MSTGIRMEQRISLITLGVHDLQKSTAFFKCLGWHSSVKAATGVAFFQCGSIVVSLFPLADLAKDAGVSPARSGFGGFAIAYNTRRREDVDTTLAEAAAAGAQIIKPAQDAFWGGYSGYFRDLDGHLWEVAWNPGFPLDERGAIQLPD